MADQRFNNPDRFYLALDHTVDPVTLATDARTRKLADLSRSFAKESGLKHFYDANVTIMHTKFYRELVQPGEVVLGADSHTSSHGGMGAFAVGLGGADVTAAMVLGETWLEVPEAISVEYEGEPRFGIGGKDIILRTLGALGRNTVAMERSVEYRGEAATSFTHRHALYHLQHDGGVRRTERHLRGQRAGGRVAGASPARLQH